MNYKARNGREYTIEFEGDEVIIYDSIGLEVTDEQRVYHEIMSKLEREEFV